MTVVDNHTQTSPESAYYAAIEACYVANPFSAGQTVLIPKGTVIRSNGELRTAKRSYKVTVRTLPMYGYVERDAVVGLVVLPRFTWSGRGGDWNEAQVTTELAAANGAQLTDFALTADQIDLLDLPEAPSVTGQRTDRWIAKD